MAVAKEQQKAVQATVDGLATERATLAQGRPAWPVWRARCSEPPRMPLWPSRRPQERL
jgi:hypothetical protein